MPVIAAAAYPLDRLEDWDAWGDKLSRWVAEGAGQGAELLVFPEYAGHELAMVGGHPGDPTDIRAEAMAIAERLPEADRILAALAAEHGVHIVAGSAPIMEDGRLLNRARLITPKGQIGAQDKLIPTRWEREAAGMAGGDRLRVFDTALGPLGIAICYDVEFPLVARALAEAGVTAILAPSCTEARSGYWRVRIGAQARALENQCHAVQAPLIGPCDWSEAVEIQTGAAAIYGPPDKGFPETGVIAEGVFDHPCWVIADCPPARALAVRSEGAVLNWSNWADQDARLDPERIELG